MEDVFTMKAGDTLPPLEATLFDEDGAATNLDGATVELHLKRVDGQGAVFVVDAEVVETLPGRVRYVWPAPQALPTVRYNGEWKVTWSDGAIKRFPNDGFFRAVIRRNLA